LVDRPRVIPTLTKTLLLTSPPGCGKTTVFWRRVERLADLRLATSAHRFSLGTRYALGLSLAPRGSNRSAEVEFVTSSKAMPSG
jgi:hypothetical protein